jgi:hypothetical protein
VPHFGYLFNATHSHIIHVSTQNASELRFILQYISWNILDLPRKNVLLLWRMSPTRTSEQWRHSPSLPRPTSRPVLVARLGLSGLYYDIVSLMHCTLSPSSFLLTFGRPSWPLFRCAGIPAFCSPLRICAAVPDISQVRSERWLFGKKSVCQPAPHLCYTYKSLIIQTRELFAVYFSMSHY